VGFLGGDFLNFSPKLGEGGRYGIMSNFCNWKIF
jgi:hypothetical protein